jgi:hypothetical protein
MCMDQYGALPEARDGTMPPSLGTGLVARLGNQMIGGPALWHTRYKRGPSCAKRRQNTAIYWKQEVRRRGS